MKLKIKYNNAWNIIMDIMNTNNLMHEHDVFKVSFDEVFNKGNLQGIWDKELDWQDVIEYIETTFNDKSKELGNGLLSNNSNGCSEKFVLALVNTIIKGVK